MKKIEHILILPALLNAAIFAFAGNSTLDIHLHDTYFVFAYAWFAQWFLVTLLIVLGMYYLLRRKSQPLPSKWVSAHVWLTCVLTLCTWLPSLYEWWATPRRYLDLSPVSPINFYYTLSVFGIITFFLIQIVFVIIGTFLLLRTMHIRNS